MSLRDHFLLLRLMRGKHSQETDDVGSSRFNLGHCEHFDIDADRRSSKKALSSPKISAQTRLAVGTGSIQTLARIR
jgi:hypothetical protein